MLRFLLTVVLLAAALLVADLAVTAFAEQRTAAQVSEVLGGSATVDLETWPVSLHLLRGRVPRAEVTAHDVELAEGASVDRLGVTLEDVRIRWSDLQRQSDRLPPAASGSFTATLTEEAVQALLGLPEQVVGVELADGFLVISLVQLAEIEADVETADGQLVIVPRTDIAGLFGAAGIPVDLSAQPGSPAVESAEVSGGQLVLRGMLRDVSG